MPMSLGDIMREADRALPRSCSHTMRWEVSLSMCMAQPPTLGITSADVQPQGLRNPACIAADSSQAAGRAVADPAAVGGCLQACIETEPC